MLTLKEIMMLRTVCYVMLLVTSVASATYAEDAGSAIDNTNIYNHRVCIAGGGIWDYSVIQPTMVPNHPFIGVCRGGQTHKPVCPLNNPNSKCWKFVTGDKDNRTNSKALPQWRACRTNPPDPMC